MGQWRHSVTTDKLSTALQIAQRVYSLAQEQNDSALMVGAYTVLAMKRYFLGDFEPAREYAVRGAQIWRSGVVKCPVEEVDVVAVSILCFEALSRWHLGEIVCSHSIMASAISLAKELNDAHGLAVALHYATVLAYYERNPAEVERLASDVIEISTRQNFPHWLVQGRILRGWACSASGSAEEGISLIEDGIREVRANGTILSVPRWLSLKAEALHLANRIPEALAAIKEADALVAKYELHYVEAELHRLRGVCLAAVGADETQIDASLRAAIITAKEQKSVSLTKQADETYAEYLRQKTSASEGRGFRLPLW